MTELFLTSQASEVLSEIAPRLKDKPKNLSVTLVTTASNPYEDHPWLDEDRRVLLELGFRVEELDLEGKVEGQTEEALSGSDIIFVGGGHTFHLLDHVKRSGFDNVVKRLVEEGIPYIGSSSGAVVAGPDIGIFLVPEYIEVAKRLRNFEGLGLVDFVIFPHWGLQGDQRRYYFDHRLPNAYSSGHKIIPLTDNHFVHVKDSLYKIEAKP